MGIWKYSEDYKEARRNDDGNDMVFRAQLRSVEHMAISVFAWDGLPVATMSRDIEYFAYRDRLCCVDTFMGVPTVCKCMQSDVNMYGLPTRVAVIYPDGSTADKPVWMGTGDDDGVVIIPDTQVFGFGRVDLVAMWADRFTDAQTTIDTQIVNQRTPIIMAGVTKAVIEKAVRAVVDIASGVKAIALEEEVLNTIKPLDLKSPWNVPDLVQWQNVCTKRMLAACGIDASAWRKAERLIVDEQESDDESLALTIQDCLNARRIAAEQLNAKYGWSVSVDVIDPVRVKSETDTDNGGIEDAAA